MKLNTIGTTIPNIIIENIEGVSVILTKEIEEDEIIFYINDLFQKIGNPSFINIMVFGNKEYAIQISNLNDISFNNINDIESDCDTFAFISINDNEIYLVGLNREDYIKHQENINQEFKTLY